VVDDKKFLTEHGIKITTPDDATRQQLVDLMKPVYDKLYKKYDWAEDMVRRIREVKN